MAACHVCLCWLILRNPLLPLPVETKSLRPSLIAILINPWERRLYNKHRLRECVLAGISERGRDCNSCGR